MAEIGFYHCTRQPAEEVAVRLAEKALGAGKRVLMAAGTEVLDALDRRLWTEIPDSFLAHGRAGEEDAALQPILLSGPEGLAAPPANGATFLMLVSLALPERLDGYERLFLLFEEGSPAQAAARTAWKGLGSREGLSRSYWQQRGRGWERAG